MAGIVDAQRGLRHIGEFAGVFGFEPGYVLQGMDKMDFAGNLPHRAFDFGVATVADQHDFVSVGGIALRFLMHFADQGAGRVNDM